jgi:hydrogenase maturation protease
MPRACVIVLDAVDLGRHPGTVVVVEPEVTDVAKLSLADRNDQLADMHYATPARAFMLARGLSILPAATWLVGCQPVDAERYGEGLSPEVENAVAAAMAEVKALVSSMGVSWS